MLPKDSDAGLTVSLPELTAIPETLRLSWASFDELIIIAIVPEGWPTSLGTKLMVKLVLWPGARSSGKPSDVT